MSTFPPVTPPPRERYVDYYRVLAETAEDHIFVIDRDDRIEYVNAAAARQHGVVPEQLIGRLRSEVFPPDVAERQRRNLLHVFDTGKSVYVEARTVYRDGEVWLGTSLAPIRDADGNVRAVLGVSRDMTARKQAEDALRKLETDLSRAQKLEALGRLAGGIAHDFNNNLTAILGYVDLMIEQLGGSSPMAHDLEEVRRSAERAAGLVRRLLAFGRRQVFQPRTLDLNAVISGLEPMLRRLLGEQIRLEVHKAPGLYSVIGDPRELEQIIMNLALNARDAMPEGGTLTIGTSNARPLPEHQATMGNGLYASMRIRDTGAGMSHHVKEHVFEPFFTTKPIGEGAGLGLSAVYGVVKQLNGFIWVESELGQGSTFHVYLPPALDEAADRVAPAPVDEQPATGVRPTILLVEDQDTVRRFARRALEHHGYRVLEAATPEEALARAQGSQPLSLLLTDVVMPSMSGPELADVLRRSRPDLPVLFMSGYPSALEMPDGSIDPTRPVVSKPFTTAQLIQVVQELLGP